MSGRTLTLTLPDSGPARAALQYLEETVCSEEQESATEKRDKEVIQAWIDIRFAIRRALNAALAEDAK